MTEKVYWKSALKAIIATLFAITLLSFLFLAIMGTDHLATVMQFFRNNHETMNALEIFLWILLTVQIFLWAGFAWIEKRFPFQSLPVTVFLYNAGITVLSWLMEQSFPAMEQLNEILLGPFNHWLTFIAVFVFQGLGFYYLYPRFKKQEDQSMSTLPTNVVFASPRRRIIAFFIDTAIQYAISITVFILILLSGVLAAVTTNTNLLSAFMLGALVTNALLTLVGALYWTVFEAKFGATIGKKLLNIKVLKTNGEKIGFQDAFFRNAPKFFSGLELVLLLEFILLLYNDKQRLFDQVTDTLVIQNKGGTK